MRSALPLKFNGYCRNSFGTKYAQDDDSAKLVKVCEGALRLVKLYPDGHGKWCVGDKSAFQLMESGNILIKESMTVHHLTASWRCMSEHGFCRDCLMARKKWGQGGLCSETSIQVGTTRVLVFPRICNFLFFNFFQHTIYTR